MRPLAPFPTVFFGYMAPKREGREESHFKTTKKLNKQKQHQSNHRTNNKKQYNLIVDHLDISFI